MPSQPKAGEGGAVKSLLSLLRFGKKKKDKGKKDALETPPTAPVEPPPKGPLLAPNANAIPLSEHPSAPEVIVNTQAGTTTKCAVVAPDVSAPRAGDETQPSDILPAAMQHDKLLAALESTQHLGEAPGQGHSARISHLNVTDLTGVLFAQRTNTQSGTGMVLPPRLAEGAASNAGGGPGQGLQGPASGCINSSEAHLHRIVEGVVGGITAGDASGGGAGGGAAGIRGGESSYVPYATTTVAPLNSTVGANFTTAATNIDSSNAPLCSVANNLQDMLFADYDTLERFQSRQAGIADRGSAGGLGGAAAAAATAAIALTGPSSGGYRRDVPKAPHVPSLLRPADVGAAAAAPQPRTTPQLELAGLPEAPLPLPAGVGAVVAAAAAVAAAQGAGAVQGPGQLEAAAVLASRSDPLAQLHLQRPQQQQHAGPGTASPGLPPGLQLDGAVGTQPQQAQAQTSPQQPSQGNVARANGVSGPPHRGSLDAPGRGDPSHPAAGSPSGASGEPPGAAPIPAVELHAVNLKRVPAPKPVAAAAAAGAVAAAGAGGAAVPASGRPAPPVPLPTPHDLAALVAGPALPSYSAAPPRPVEPAAPLRRPMKLTTACLSAYTTLYDHGADQSFQRALQRKMQLVLKWMAASDLTAPPDNRLEVPMDPATVGDDVEAGGGGGLAEGAVAVGGNQAEGQDSKAACVGAGPDAHAPGAEAAVAGPVTAPPGQNGGAASSVDASRAAPMQATLHHVPPTSSSHPQQQQQLLQHASHPAGAGASVPAATADSGLGRLPGARHGGDGATGPPPQVGATGAVTVGVTPAAKTQPGASDPLAAAAATGAQQPLQHSLSDLYGNPQAAVATNLPPRMLAGSEADPATATIAAAAAAGHDAESVAAAAAVPPPPEAATAAAAAAAVMQQQQAAAAASSAAQSSNGGSSVPGSGPGRTKTIAVASHCPPELQPHPAAAAWTIDDFSLLKKLYEGSLSVVCQAQHKRSGRHVALKIYKRSRLHEMERFQLAREICLHIRIVHPHVVGLFAAWKDSKYVYLALDWAPLGNMFDYLVARGGRLGEEEAARVVVRPLMSALAFLHSQHFIHRDVKLENLLLDASNCLKLADFGLAIDQKFEQANTRLGTFGYFAPEVLDCPLKKGPFDMKDTSVPGYDSRVDVWSAGVVAYEVLTGRAPFSASSPAKIIQAIRSRVLEFPGISEEGVDFLRSALTRDPAARPTAKQLLNHPWILRHGGGGAAAAAAALPPLGIPPPVAAPEAAPALPSPPPILASSSATVGGDALAAASASATPPQALPLTADGAVGVPTAGGKPTAGGAGAATAS